LLRIERGNAIEGDFIKLSIRGGAAKEFRHYDNIKVAFLCLAASMTKKYLC